MGKGHLRIPPVTLPKNVDFPVFQIMTYRTLDKKIKCRIKAVRELDPQIEMYLKEKVRSTLSSQEVRWKSRNVQLGK